MRNKNHKIIFFCFINIVSVLLSLVKAPAGFFFRAMKRHVTPGTASLPVHRRILRSNGL